MNDCGIVYAATKGERYLEEAFLSAESAKRLAPGISVTLFTDLGDNPLCGSDCFDQVHKVEGVSGFSSGWAEGQLNRLLSLPKTPYARTLHLDSDTRILTPDFRKLFELLDEIDVALVETAEDASYSRSHYGRPMFSAGFVLFRKTDPVMDWLKDWAEVSRDYFKKAGMTPLPQVDVIAHIADETIRRKLLCMDQTSLVTMPSPSHSTHGLKVMGLDYTWNHAGSHAPENNRGPIRILHNPILKKRTHYDVLQVARAWVEQGRTSQAAMLYDYVAHRSLRPTRRSGWIGKFLPPISRVPEQWQTPRLTRADLHRRHGQFAMADTLFREADAAEEAYAAAGQAELHLAENRNDSAFALATHATQLKPVSGNASRVFGTALSRLGHQIEAIAHLHSAEKRDDPEGAYQLGQAFFALADYPNAAKAYKRALARDPTALRPANNLMPALLGSRDYVGALKQADTLIAQYDWHPAAFAFKCMALAELGRTDEERQLADLKRLVAVETVSPPAGFESLPAFNRALARALLREPSLEQAPPQHATRHGLHSGDLSEATDPSLSALRGLILEAVMRRRNAIAPNATHAFERYAAETFTYHAWAVIMEDQGHQIPHMHADGWLSGVYYVQVPPEVRPNDPDHAGWISFGRGEQRWHTETSTSVERLICPEPGMLVTFPSYTWHSTIPLRSTARRISYAFDIIPT